MARFRLSPLAQGDVAHILATSADRWGPQARRRYEALLATAMRQVAAAPNGPATRDRTDLMPGIRSFHLRLTRSNDPRVKAKRPMHVLYYRALVPDLVEIVRVLHERMESRRHVVGSTP